MRLNDETREWAAGLTERQLGAVRRWQSADRFYEQVQQAYRGQTGSAEAVEVADQLLGVATHPLINSYIGWRGVRSSNATFGVAADRLEELITDESTRLGRFFATTLARDVAVNEFTEPQLKGGAVLIEVTLRAGTRVAWIPPVGSGDLVYQQEVLVHPNMVQRIVSVSRTGPVPVVRMEVKVR